MLSVSKSNPLNSTDHQNQQKGIPKLGIPFLIKSGHKYKRYPLQQEKHTAAGMINDFSLDKQTYCGKFSKICQVVKTGENN